MAQYTYDPTKGKVVPLAEAVVVTYITTDPNGMPDEQTKKTAAAAAVTAAQGAGIPTKSGGGGITDSQNAARLEAERVAAEKSPYNVRSTEGDELLKKQAAKNAANAPARYTIDTPTPTPTPTPTATPTPTPTPTPSIFTAGMTAEEIADAATKAAAEAEVAATTAAAGVAATEPKVTAIAKSADKGEADAAVAAGTATTNAQKTAEAAQASADALQAAADAVKGLAGADAAQKAADAAQEEADAAQAAADEAAADTDLDGSDENEDAVDVADGTTYTAPDGKIFTNLGLYNAYIDKLKSDEKRQRGQSAYELLYEEFDRYGLASLVTEIEEFIKDGLSKAELTLKLRGTQTYQTRFAANAERVKNGLAAISEAEYIGLEDQYQNIMRNYGLPESYYARSKDKFGTQEGFQKFIANDVSATELEDRIMTAQKRILFANPEVGIALKTFYPDITNGDLLAYALDPTKGIEQIKRRITAAEVGSSAVQLGLTTNVTDAEYLARYGVTKETAQQGYGTIAGGLKRGSQLASIYGEDPYTQTTAEREVFAVPGATESKAARKKIIGLEKATFGGQTGMSSTALARDRAGAF
jgi:hypothetical protein